MGFQNWLQVAVLSCLFAKYLLATYLYLKPWLRDLRLVQQAPLSFLMFPNLGIALSFLVSTFGTPGLRLRVSFVLI